MPLLHVPQLIMLTCTIIHLKSWSVAQPSLAPTAPTNAHPQHPPVCSDYRNFPWEDKEVHLLPSAHITVVFRVDGAGTPTCRLDGGGRYQPPLGGPCAIYSDTVVCSWETYQSPKRQVIQRLPSSVDTPRHLHQGFEPPRHPHVDRIGPTALTTLQRLRF